MKFVLVILIVIGLFLVIIPHVLYVLIKLVSLVAKFNVCYKPYGIASLGLAISWVLLFFYGNQIGRFRHEVKNIEIQDTSVPSSFDGYKIVHISDLHLDGWTGHEDKLREVIEEINFLHPDLICFTGDLVSLSDKELIPFIPILKNLKATDGVVSVLGNHDYLPYAHMLSNSERHKALDNIVKLQREELRWQLLLNEHVFISNDTDSIAVIGCENQSVGAHPVIQRGNLNAATEGVDDNIFRILLTHDPSHWRAEVVDHTSVPLTLSGHTHAMQFRICGFSPSRWIYPEYDGMYQEGNQHLYVNIGLGGTMPMRIGATPEITLITLRSK